MRTEVKFNTDQAALNTLESLAASGARSHYEHVEVHVAVQRLEELIYRMRSLEK